MNDARLDKYSIPPHSRRTPPPTGTVNGKLVRTVLSIVALVSVLTLVVVFYRGIQISEGHQATVSEQIVSGIRSKGTVLTENHALALRTLVEDNSFGDVQRLIGRTVREDEQVTAGIFLPTEGEPWAYFSRTHPPPADLDTPATPSDEWKGLGLNRDSVSGEAVKVAQATWFEEPVYTFAKAVESDGERLGTVHYSLSTKAMREALAEAKAEAERAMKTQLFSLGGLALLGMLIGFLLARREAKRITKPLAVLTAAAEEIANGSTGARALVRCGDEIEVLAGSFNKMVEDLERSHRELARMNRGLESTVKARTAELSERNAEMRVVLDNVEEGLVTMSLDGTLRSETSAAFKDFFAVPANDTKLWECVGADDERFVSNLEFGWEQVADGFLPSEIALDQLPKQLKSHGRNYVLEFKPLFKSETVNNAEPELKGALLIVADVTEQQEAARKDAEQREAMAVFKRVMRDKSGFMEFFAEAQALLAKANSKQVADHNEMMRVLHTLKGNCGIFGVKSVASVCHELESWVVENEALPSDEMLMPLQSTFQQFADQVEELVGTQDDAILEVQESDLGEIITAVAAKKPTAIVVSMLERLRCDPTFDKFKRIADQAEQLAQKMSKPDLSVMIEDNGVRLPQERWASFWSSMIHVVRNALDHGIETPEERVGKGKSPGGTLVLSSKVVDDHFQILVSDDGAGVSWEKIREKAQAVGMPFKTRKDLVDALFADGLSSREETTELSGRGVGMGAVREACRAMGGDVRVESEANIGTRFIFIVPVANNDRAGRSAA